jgi:hypothetical protein
VIEEFSILIDTMASVSLRSDNRWLEDVITCMAVLHRDALVRRRMRELGCDACACELGEQVVVEGDDEGDRHGSELFTSSPSLP